MFAFGVFFEPSLSQATKKETAADTAKLSLLVKHFAVVDTNATFKAHEEESAAKLRVLKQAEFNAKYNRPVRLIQRWYRKVLETRAAGKKKKKGGGKKGGGAKKGGKKKKKT